jgi:uncharacterized protein YecA (UPF0149 family)
MDRQSYLITLENHLVSNDDIIRNFMLDILNRSFIGDESTFMIGLEANRKNRVVTQSNLQLKYLKNLPMPAEGVRRLLSDLRDEDADEAAHYMSLLNHADPCLVEQFQREISTALKEKGLKVANSTFYTDLCSNPRDIIFQKFQGVIRKMNSAESFNQNHFILGKQMIELIAKRKLMGENEVLYRLRKMKKRQKLTLSDLYDIVLAGDMKIEAAIPKLVVLLTLHSEDEIFSDEMVNALVKIGTNDVVDFVKPLILEGNKDRFHAIDVLSNIKTEYAKKTLLDWFKSESGPFEKTMIAAGLCEQFSKEAIPHIENFIDEGYETGLLPLEEYLYCNCVVNRVNHARLAEWKGRAVKLESMDKSQASELEKQEKEFEQVEEQKPLAQEDREDELEIEVETQQGNDHIAEINQESQLEQVDEQEKLDSEMVEESEIYQTGQEESVIQNEEVRETDEQDIEMWKQLENLEKVHESDERVLQEEESKETVLVAANSEESIEPNGSPREMEKKPSPQKRIRSNQRDERVSNEEMRAAMKRLLNARKQNEAQKKTVKTGRNDPCPCGSGKKYKKCCM